MRVAVLRVTSPEGEVGTHELASGPLTVGRPSPGHAPDVALSPDPQRWVGRVHCTLDLDDGLWSVADNGSVNGTLLRHDGTTRRLEGRRRVQHGDAVLILGDMDAAGEPVYWELTFLDPHTTQPAPFGPPPAVAVRTPCLRYDWVGAQAHRCAAGPDTPDTPVTGLRPQGHQLIRYMVGRSREGEAVACSHAELISALWGDPEEWPAHRVYTRNDLAGVVRATRRCIEAEPSSPVLLQTVTGFGYRLIVCDGEPG
ncbi:FHA domain-containing protein [Actinomycetospora aeridis]|uniref:FHA domain-containing protein n=1 Tax=Actinomycetospora aeridis TaxID=3129231 RepID=A0ABU8MZ91_9PSEU